MNNKYKVLVVEDDDDISGLLKTLLEANGYYSIEADTMHNGILMFVSYRPDLVILDLGLPDADGMEFIKNIRRSYLTPILVLSARSDESDKVEALDAGANDYVTKPFGSAELLARVRSLLRANRYSAEEGRHPGGKFTAGGLEIDYDARKVSVYRQEIKLTQTEFNIMAMLSEHFGKVLTYSAIIKGIWGYSDSGSIKKLQVNMANIRRKLGIKPGDSKYISNELGVGYRMHNDEER